MIVRRLERNSDRIASDINTSDRSDHEYNVTPERDVRIQLHVHEEHLTVAVQWLENVVRKVETLISCKRQNSIDTENLKTYLIFYTGCLLMTLFFNTKSF